MVRVTRSMRILMVLSLLGAGLTGCGKQKEAMFGAVLPLSGEAQAYGEAIRRGVELAHQEIMKSEGYPYKLRLEVRDSASIPEQGATLLAELYSQGALAAVGGITSAEALDMVKVADEYDAILLSPSASSPELTGMSRHFFRIFPSDFVEGTKMGIFARQTIELENCAVLAVESAYGEGIQGVFVTEFKRHGGEILEVLEYPDNTSDFSGLIERIMTLGPQAVFLVDLWEELVEQMRGLRSVGYEGKILTTSAFATTQALAAAGEDAEGLFFTQTVFDLASEAEPIRGFRQSFQTAYGEDPGIYAAHGYDAMKLLAEALRTGGTLPSDFEKGILGISSFPGVTGSLQFDEKGDVQKYPRVYRIKDGQPLNYEEYVRDMKQAFQDRLREIEERRKALLRSQR